MPPVWWLDEQAEALSQDYGDEARDIARAALFAAYLDRRSPLPLVQDLRFHLQLYRAALEQPWIRTPTVHGTFQEEGTAACGLEPPVLCCTSHQGFEEFLVRQTDTYFQEEIRSGQTRFRPDRRVLPHPSGAPTQLRLDFQVA